MEPDLSPVKAPLTPKVEENMDETLTDSKEEMKPLMIEMEASTSGLNGFHHVGEHAVVNGKDVKEEVKLNGHSTNITMNGVEKEEDSDEAESYYVEGEKTIWEPGSEVCYSTPNADFIQAIVRKEGSQCSRTDMCYKFKVGSTWDKAKKEKEERAKRPPPPPVVPATPIVKKPEANGHIELSRLAAMNGMQHPAFGNMDPAQAQMMQLLMMHQVQAAQQAEVAAAQQAAQQQAQAQMEQLQAQKISEMKPSRNGLQRACARKSPYFRSLEPEKELQDEFITPDLQDMIIQRAPAVQLKEIARVRKNWRSYIKENSEKMRRYAKCIWLDRPSQASIYYQEGRYKKEVSIPDMLLYSTKKLRFKKMSEQMATELSSQLEGSPDWWINGIKEICFHVSCLYPLSTFIQRFSYLDELFLHEHRTNILERTTPKEEIPDLLKALIKNAPMTKQFQIDNLSVDDSFLEAVMEKSQIYPTEFPILDYRANLQSKFTVAQVIRFLELNRFPYATSHQIELLTVIGDKDEMQNWIDKNTRRIAEKKRKMLPTMAARKSSIAISREFRYRGMTFDFRVQRTRES